MKIEKLRNVQCPICRYINKIGKYEDESYALVLFCYMGHLAFILNSYEETLYEEEMNAEDNAEAMMNCRCFANPIHQGGLIGLAATRVPHPIATVKGFLKGFNGMGLV